VDSDELGGIIDPVCDKSVVPKDRLALLWMIGRVCTEWVMRALRYLAHDRDQGIKRRLWQAIKLPQGLPRKPHTIDHDLRRRATASSGVTYSPIPRTASSLAS
jgi:hypothetical protein